jgi:hypothetical protein
MNNNPGDDVMANFVGDFELTVFDSEKLKEKMDMALDETGKREKRKRKLPAFFMACFVILMSLNRDKSYANLKTKVISILRDMHPDADLPLGSVTDEALIKARLRLGHEPLKMLFEALAEEAIPEPSLFGLRTWGIDGVSFTLVDTEANEEEFGRPGSSRGDAAFPQMQMVPLIATDTHLIRAAVFGRYKSSERLACAQLLEYLGEGDLLFVDRGFPSVGLLRRIAARGIEFIARISSSWKPIKTKELGPGDYLVTITGREDIPPEERVEGGPKTRVATMKLRLIEFTIGGNKKVRLLTTLLDPQKYPACDIGLEYHRRWESENANDEFKTHLFTVTHGTLHTNFRSKTPKGIKQELFGLLVAYNLIRSLMVEAARTHDIPPLEISFLQSVEVIKEALPRFEAASSSDYVRLSRQLFVDLAACRLKRPRRKRSNPRKVKVKMSKFGRKRAQDRGAYRDFEAEFQLLKSAG